MKFDSNWMVLILGVATLGVAAYLLYLEISASSVGGTPTDDADALDPADPVIDDDDDADPDAVIDDDAATDPDVGGMGPNTSRYHLGRNNYRTPISRYPRATHRPIRMSVRKGGGNQVPYSRLGALPMGGAVRAEGY